MTHAHNISAEVANYPAKCVLLECAVHRHARTTYIQATRLQLAALLLAAFAFGMFLSLFTCR